MANQVIVTNTGNVQVAIEPTPNVQVQISRAAIGTVSNVPTANFANYAANVTASNQPNITNVGTLGNLSVSGNTTLNNLTVTGNFVANVNVGNANYANFAGTAFNVSGSNVSGAVSLATSATTANSVAGANVSGQVANALVAGTVYTNAQPNITSVGNLTSLTSTGNITAPFFIGNVVGNISGNLVVPGTNTSVLFNQVGNAGASDAFQFNYATNVATITGNLSATNISGNGTGLSNIAGANVTGVVANANYSAFAGQANTANLATFATTANAVAGANVSGEVANANYSSYANIAASANSVAVANVSGIGNIATINLDGNSSNVLYGNGVFATISIPAGDQISNGTSNVSIPVANSNIEIYANNQHWTFGTSGNLILANGNSVVQSIANSSLDILNPNVSTMVLTPDQNYTSQALVLDPTFNGHIHLRAPGANIDQPVANLYLGGEISSFEVGQFNGAVPNLFIRSNNQTWTFDIGGNLTLPANTFAINYANGTQVPLDGPVANANYANFAGTAYSVDGANVSGEVANANYSSYANIAASANSVALANVSGVGNIANINLDGSSSNVLFGNGVFAPESTSIANANYANFAGTAFNVSGSNVSGEVANANYSSFANIAASANSVAVANVSGIGNIATVNLTGSSSNVLYGNGVFAPETTSVANANYANFAGTVITNAQPNITSVGNLLSVQVSNSANSTGVIRQTDSGNITFTQNQSNIATFQLTTQYHPNNSASYPGDRIIRSRGNVASPTTVSSGDRILGRNGYGFNGNTNAISVAETFTIVGVNANANAQWMGGQWNITTGNPSGDTANQGNNSWQNQLIFTNSASLQINPGTPANVSAGQNTSAILITSYGASTTDLVGAGGLNQQRARGNRDALLSVQPNDNVGRISFWGYNGANYQSGQPAAIIARVDNSYVANATVIPLNWTIRAVSSSNTQVDTIFYGNGTASFPGAIIATSGNSNIGNLQLNRFQETVFAIGNTSGTITPDFNNGSIQTMTLTGNVTINSLGNANAGSSMTLILTQDGTGNRILTSSMKFAGGVKTLSTTANAIDIISVFYDGSTYYSSLTKGYV